MRFELVLSFFGILLIAKSQVHGAKSLKCSISTKRFGWIEHGGNFKACQIKNQAINSEGFVISEPSDDAIKGFYIEHDKTVKFFPENLEVKFPKLIGFQVRHCSVEEIKKSQFEELRDLKYLTLTYNKIKDIESQSFANLKKLETLSLNDNKIEYLHSDLFKSLVSLKALGLYNNLIEFINPETFSTLSSLLNLDLHDNKIQFLAQNTFENLSNLEILSLNNNEFEEVDENLFKNNIHLLEISLYGNKLGLIPAKTFEGLSKLKNVDLQQNQCINKNFFPVNHAEIKALIQENCTMAKFMELKGNSFSFLKSKIEVAWEHQKLENIELKNILKNKGTVPNKICNKVVSDQEKHCDQQKSEIINQQKTKMKKWAWKLLLQIIPFNFVNLFS